MILEIESLCPQYSMLLLVALLILKIDQPWLMCKVATTDDVVFPLFVLF